MTDGYVDDITFLRSEIAKMPIEPPPHLISEWVDGFRVMPPNTPFPGPWNNSRTPYGIEIADGMSPYSPVQITSVLKGAQLGLTAWAENVVGYWMAACPSEVLYVSATDDLLEKWSSKRLEPLINSIGMRDRIHAQKDPLQTRSKRTGDTTMRKEYVGGTLDMASAQSASSLRSDSKRILVLDEIDGAPRMLKTGEGNWLDVAYARTNAWGARKKILEFSTPTTIEESLIWERYEAGDRRVFKVPCPHCGAFDMLRFRHLKHEMKDGQLHKVWYECPHCDGHIFNHHKTAMLAAGYWEPTAVAQTKGHRSYYISSLYSPAGMMSWYELYEHYLRAKSVPGGMRSFITLYLGMPYKESGFRPKVEKVIELRGDYLDGKEVPDGVIFLTVGADVQQGSANDPNNPPRIELEVLGHGLDFRTWSILYKVIPGEVSRSAFEGAWEALNEWIEKGGMVFRRADGMKFGVDLALIDSGDGTNVDIVYGFCARLKNTLPCKGFNVLKKQKDEKGDEMGAHNFKRYRLMKNERLGGLQLVELSTNYYKGRTYTNLNIPRREFEPQAPGYCSFPRDRSERFFLQLTSEERRTDGSFHAGGRRNEALDCRVYALGAADIFLDSKVTAARLAMKAQGASDMQLQQITQRTILEQMAAYRGIGVRRVTA